MKLVRFHNWSNRRITKRMKTGFQTLWGFVEKVTHSNVDVILFWNRKGQRHSHEHHSIPAPWPLKADARFTVVNTMELFRMGIKPSMLVYWTCKFLKPMGNIGGYFFVSIFFFSPPPLNKTNATFDHFLLNMRQR